jgi:RND family efflux transporter MFP subunit
MNMSLSLPCRFNCWKPLLAGLAVATSLAVQAQALPTRVVDRHPVDLTFSAEALVEAVNQATLAAQVSGRIVEVLVDAGQMVKKGDPLMKIDAREASEAAAGAAAQQVNARAHYQRMLSLRQQGFISQAAVDKARADLDAAQATQGQTSIGVGHATVRAPMSGVVAQRLSELGEMAVPGKPLLSIYEPGSLRVTASIPQQRLSQMRSLRQARIEFPELGKSVAATNVSVLPTADAATHVVAVRVGLPAGIADIVPGMHARAHFVVGRASKLSVPQRALLRRGEVVAVYVQDPHGALSLRQLRLGETLAADEVEVLAGLQPGERVVLDAVQAAVQIKSARPLGK